MTIKIYHNPKCSKSRQALGLLTDRGLDVRIVAYLEEPPSEDELAAIVKKLGIAPRDLLRTSEPEYRRLALDSKALSDTEILRAIAEHPILMQRPIVVSKRGARIGRPPELILEIVE
ncbi:MAG: arsenate reductase (glutaredoxin) [Gammaproteobacteria bacterium]|nr:arsenate reductase (glutaredoxin) [Gammaproteobacteria bacterium]